MEKLEEKVQKLENQMVDVSEAINLIKTYGFQPKQFEELLKAHKSNEKSKKEVAEKTT